MEVLGQDDIVWKKVEWPVVILVTFMTKVMFRCLVHLLLSQIVATTHPSHLLAI